MRIWIKRLLMIILVGLLCSVALMIISNRMVDNYASSRIYSSIKDIPKNKVGLVLGTAKHNKYGGINLYYKYRIEATIALYKAGKIDYVLVSGDNGSKQYDEPTDFKDDLIKGGIPADKIYLDYAGFRTLDSIVRAKKIFGLNQLTIISQQFHNERALFLSKYSEIEAVAYNATDPQGKYTIRVKVREVFARVKMMIDLVFGKQPKFLGDKITIGK